jgi:hypothetical protein
VTTKELLPEVLYKRCNPADLAFDTTAELPADLEVPGQARAAEALKFGLGIDRQASTFSPWDLPERVNSFSSNTLSTDAHASVPSHRTCAT